MSYSSPIYCSRHIHWPHSTLASLPAVIDEAVRRSQMAELPQRMWVLLKRFCTSIWNRIFVYFVFAFLPMDFMESWKIQDLNARAKHCLVSKPNRGLDSQFWILNSGFLLLDSNEIAHRLPRQQFEGSIILKKNNFAACVVVCVLHTVYCSLSWRWSSSAAQLCAVELLRKSFDCTTNH